jgi:hypothetical protein
MTKFKINQASLNRATQAIAQEWYENIMKEKSQLENEGSIEIKEAIEFLKVKDTGGLRLNSKMKMNGFNRVVQWEFITENINYAVYPRNGLGSSRAYGPRKYDVRGAIKMINKYKLKVVGTKPTLAEAGKPRTAKAKKTRDKTLSTLKSSGYTRMQSLRIARKISQRKTGIRAYEGVPNRGKK